jgi:sodium/bile acid cotransporter 7
MNQTIATQRATRRIINQIRPDWFVLSLIGTVAAASLLPCHGASARMFSTLGMFAIGSLFFLQGARLSRAAITAGMTHWRLHLCIATCTFVVFPLLGSVLVALFPHAMNRELWLGVLFACALPSTVQSSIALVSMAQGNVPGAICAATGSNVLGFVLTPILLALTSHLHGGAVNVAGIWKVLLQLLAPFAAGHLLRPWIGEWAQRNRAVLAITDRSSILLVVYTAFSAGTMHGIWHQLPPLMLTTLALVAGMLLLLVLAVAITTSRALGFDRADEIAIVLCGSQKSLVTGVPMASALFSSAVIGQVMLPLMIYYPMQLVVGAWLARRYATRHAASGYPVAANL